MNAPKTSPGAAPDPTTREVADPEEIERPGRPEDGDDPDARTRALEGAHTWRQPGGSYTWQGPDE
jgi:hypothetical protein